MGSGKGCRKGCRKGAGRVPEGCRKVAGEGPGRRRGERRLLACRTPGMPSCAASTAAYGTTPRRVRAASSTSVRAEASPPRSASPRRTCPRVKLGSSSGQARGRLGNSHSIGAHRRHEPRSRGHLGRISARARAGDKCLALPSFGCGSRRSASRGRRPAAGRGAARSPRRAALRRAGGWGARRSVRGGVSAEGRGYRRLPPQERGGGETSGGGTLPVFFSAPPSAAAPLP